MEMKHVLLSIIVLCVLWGVWFWHHRKNNMYTLGRQAYVFAYPLVLMDVTKNIMTSSANLPGHGAVNTFNHAREFPDATFKDIVRPNVDTLYSMAWLDLAQEPIVLSLPDTYGRYYLMPLLDAWTNVFASLGARTTGTQAQQYVIVGPNWQGELPSTLEKISAPTNLVWILGRTQTNGKKDYAAVHAIQDGYKLTPLSARRAQASNIKTERGKLPRYQGAPSDAVAAMDARTFFTYFAHVLKNNPASTADAPMLSKLAQMGIVPGNDFDTAKLSDHDLQELNRAIAAVRHEITARKQNIGPVVHGWQIARKDIGTYGTHYAQRAIIAYFGIGANLPEDAIYPTTWVDRSGNQLNGRNKYQIHFARHEIPPVNAFWSLTLYNEESFLVKNQLNRYALGDRDALNFNPDGSLDIYIQHEAPEREKMANWLPAPDGDFNLTLRLYWPKKSVLDGTWNPPAVDMVNTSN